MFVGFIFPPKPNNYIINDLYDRSLIKANYFYFGYVYKHRKKINFCHWKCMPGQEGPIAVVNY